MNSSQDRTDWLGIVSRFRTGCREAAEELGENLSVLSYRFFRYTGLCREDAEDLTQDSVWHIVVHLGQFHGGQFTAWVYTILRHKVADWARHRRLPCVPLTEADLNRAQSVADGDGTLDEGALRALDEALGTLSAKERVVLESRLARTTVAYEDIGREVGASPGTVRVQYARTLRKLRLRLERDKHMQAWLRSHDAGAGMNRQTKLQL